MISTAEMVYGLTEEEIKIVEGSVIAKERSVYGNLMAHIISCSQVTRGCRAHSPALHRTYIVPISFGSAVLVTLARSDSVCREMPAR
jgi:hypothetical protein